MEIFIGFIGAFGFNFAPRDWTHCAGQLIAISDNPSLFSLLSDFYGGDSRVSFGIPELRGRIPLGYGQSPGQPDYRIGQKVGSLDHTLSVLQMPVHTHAAVVTGSGSGGGVFGVLEASQENGEHEQPEPGDLLAASFKARGDLNKGYVSSENAGVTVPLGGLTVQGDPGSITVTNADTGASESFLLMQPTLAINYCIALQGIFPPRN